MDYNQQINPSVLINVESLSNLNIDSRDNVAYFNKSPSKLNDGPPEESSGVTTFKTNVDLINIRTVLSNNDQIFYQKSLQCCEWLVLVIKKIVHLIFHVMAILNSAALLKWALLHYSKKGDLYRSITTGYFLLQLTIKISFTKLCMINSEDMCGLLDTILTMELGNSNGSNKSNLTSLFRKCWIALCIASLLMSIICSLFRGLELSEWSFELMLCFRSYSFITDLLIWTTENYENRTTDLDLLYGTNLTETTISLGTLKLLADFCDYFQSFLIGDLFILLAVMNYKLTKGVRFPTASVNGTSCNLEFQRMWACYTRLQDITVTIDKVLGNLLKHMHLNHIFLCTYFLLECIDGNFGPFFCTMGIYIIKISVSYYASTKAAEMNEIFKFWFQQSYADKHFVEFQSKHLKCSYILDAIRSRPVGVGIGMFFINKAFCHKLIGVVGSYFVILYTVRNNQQNNDDE